MYRPQPFRGESAIRVFDDLRDGGACPPFVPAIASQGLVAFSFVESHRRRVATTSPDDHDKRHTVSRGSRSSCEMSIGTFGAWPSGQFACGIRSSTT